MRSRTCVVFYLWPRAGGTTFSLSFKVRFPMKAQSSESSSTITTIHKQRGRRFLLYASWLSETKYVAFYKRHKRQFDHSAIFCGLLTSVAGSFSLFLLNVGGTGLATR